MVPPVDDPGLGRTGDAALTAVRSAAPGAIKRGGGHDQVLGNLVVAILREAEGEGGVQDGTYAFAVGLLALALAWRRC